MATKGEYIKRTDYDNLDSLLNNIEYIIDSYTTYTVISDIDNGKSATFSFTSEKVKNYTLYYTLNYNDSMDGTTDGWTALDANTSSYTYNFVNQEYSSRRVASMVKIGNSLSTPTVTEFSVTKCAQASGEWEGIINGKSINFSSTDGSSISGYINEESDNISTTTRYTITGSTGTFSVTAITSKPGYVSNSITKSTTISRLSQPEISTNISYNSYGEGAGTVSISFPSNASYISYKIGSSNESTSYSKITDNTLTENSGKIYATAYASGYVNSRTSEVSWSIVNYPFASFCKMISQLYLDSSNDNSRFRYWVFEHGDYYYVGFYNLEDRYYTLFYTDSSRWVYIFNNTIRTYINNNYGTSIGELQKYTAGTSTSTSSLSSITFEYDYLATSEGESGIFIPRSTAGDLVDTAAYANMYSTYMRKAVLTSPDGGIVFGSKPQMGKTFWTGLVDSGFGSDSAVDATYITYNADDNITTSSGTVYTSSGTSGVPDQAHGIIFFYKFSK